MDWKILIANDACRTDACLFFVVVEIALPWCTHAQKINDPLWLLFEWTQGNTSEAAITNGSFRQKKMWFFFFHLTSLVWTKVSRAWASSTELPTDSNLKETKHTHLPTTALTDLITLAGIRQEVTWDFCPSDVFVDEFEGGGKPYCLVTWNEIKPNKCEHVAAVLFKLYVTHCLIWTSEKFRSRTLHQKEEKILILEKKCPQLTTQPCNHVEQKIISDAHYTETCVGCVTTAKEHNSVCSCKWKTGS